MGDGVDGYDGQWDVGLHFIQSKPSSLDGERKVMYNENETVCLSTIDPAWFMRDSRMRDARASQ